MIDEVVSRGMGGRVEVSEKDVLASERGGGAGGGMGTAADGTVKAKGVHGEVEVDAVLALEEVKSLNH